MALEAMEAERDVQQAGGGSLGERVGLKPPVGAGMFAIARALRVRPLRAWARRNRCRKRAASAWSLAPTRSDQKSKTQMTLVSAPDIRTPAGLNVAFFLALAVSRVA